VNSWVGISVAADLPFNGAATILGAISASGQMPWAQIIHE
jgi:hypothetical protein